MADQTTNTKRAAALQAVEYVKNGMTLGLGTGSTAYWAIMLIGSRVKAGLDVKGVATSSASESLALEMGIPIVSFADVERLDLTIDGADEVDESLHLIKGGGGALVREKIVAAASAFYIIIADESKLVSRLGLFPLPVEVVQFGWELTFLQLQKLGCVPQLRLSDHKPFVSDNGNYIIDCSFITIPEPETLHEQINSITGVVDNGLFLNLADMVVLGYNDGSTRVLRKRK